VVGRYDKDAKIYVFGSVLKGRFTAASDIDLLIVCNEIDTDEAENLKVGILRSVGYTLPIQLHVTTTTKFKEWYLKFIDKIEEI